MRNHLFLQKILNSMGKFTKLAVTDVPDFNVVYVSGNMSYANTSTKQANLKIVQNIKNKFLPYIDKWGKELEIDSAVLIGFIAVESGGKENLGPNGADATGLCQVTRVNIREVLPKFKIITKQPLPDVISSYLSKKAPYLLSKDFNTTQKLSSTNMASLSKLLTSDNEFNILMGALALRWLFEFLKYDGQAYLNKTIIGYNQSAYGRIKVYKNKPVTTMELYKDSVIPKETRNYLAKFLGRDGFLQLIIENKVY